METRPYFVAGDLISNLSVGALVAGVGALLVGPGWNMVAAMAFGMVLGMVVSLPLGFLLSGLFGAMETLLPTMTTGMVAGMVVAMEASGRNVPFGDAIWLGAKCGMGVLLATYAANALLKRRATRWTS